MFENARRLTESPRFQGFILAVIVLNAVVVGLDATPELAPWSPALEAINSVVLWIFAFEIAVRFVATGPRLHRFFRSGWNVFDLAVVLVSALPAVGPFGTVARLARVLRVARLVEFSPKLRLVIDTMLRSVPSVGHIALLLGVVMYVYAIVGHHLFKDVNEDTARTWGSLGAAMWTMFQTMTFENWVTVQAPLVERSPLASLFFVSFILLTTFTVLNLLIAVIMSNLEEIKAERDHERAEAAGVADVAARLERLRTEIEELQALVTRGPAAGRG